LHLNRPWRPLHKATMDHFMQDGGSDAFLSSRTLVSSLCQLSRLSLLLLA
jgi:hypothetical protein